MSMLLLESFGLYPVFKPIIKWAKNALIRIANKQDEKIEINEIDKGELWAIHLQQDYSPIPKSITPPPPSPPPPRRIGGVRPRIKPRPVPRRRM